VRNDVAPYSYFNLMGSDPPCRIRLDWRFKDGLRNLREVPEFVANIVTMHTPGKDALHLGRLPKRGGRIRLGMPDTGTLRQSTAVSRRVG
jgi:hypothetical protein